MFMLLGFCFSFSKFFEASLEEYGSPKVGGISGFFDLLLFLHYGATIQDKQLLLKSIR